MTREEAIRFLNEQKEFLLKGCFWEETRMNTNEAFDMAIKALEQPEIIRCEECRHYRTCEIFGKKITLCKRREYDALSVEPDDFCSYAERKEQDDG